MIKYCKDCKHYRKVYKNYEKVYWDPDVKHECYHPKFRDVVGNAETCSSVRDDNKKCGNNALGFEQKPPYIPPPKVWWEFWRK